MMNRKIVIISDLHWASEKSIDNFNTERIPLFINFCKALIVNNVDTLILNGDIFELWQGSGSSQQILNTILKRYKDAFYILKELSNVIKVIFLYGNHDEECKKYMGWNNVYNEIIQTNSKEYLIHIEHGNKYDKIPNWLSKLATNIFEFIEKIVGPNAQKWADNITNWSFPANKNYKGDFSEYINGAKKIIENNKDEYTICIFGHTHQPDIKEFSNGIYLNSGTLINDRFDYILIDIDNENLKYNIKQYKGDFVI